MEEDKVAIAIIRKWLKKGNISRCMRDLLPSSSLNLIERERVAELIHKIVRWKRWYDFLMDYYNLEKIPENYVKIAKNEISFDYEEVEKNIPKGQYIAIRQSFSDFMAKIVKSYPEFIKHLNEEAKTTLCVNFNKSSRAEVIEMLKKEGLQAKKSLLETSLITESRARYSQVVKKGFAHVQDESSQLIAKIVSMLGKKILDYCAGNGGKTLAMASITKNNATIHVHDENKNRLKTLERRALLYNAKIFPMNENEKYDVVLVDAPCTGVGAARRNPEAKYTASLNNFPEKQLEILKNASNFVKSYLIYSICSFIPEETMVVEKLNGFKKIDFKLNGLKKTKNGFFTWLPEGDILFISILKRK